MLIGDGGSILVFFDMCAIHNQAMEWYYGRGDEDVTVPEDEEGLRSWGDRWPSWVGNCSSSSEVEPLHHPILSSQQTDDWDVHLKDLPKIQEADDIFLYCFQLASNLLHVCIDSKP